MVKKKIKKNLDELMAEALIEKKDQSYQIPDNWEWVYLLSGAAECLDNYRKPINAKERAKRQGNIPYYGATGQVGYIDDYLTNEELVLLGEDGAPFLDPYKNKAYMISGKAWVNNHAHILKSLYGKTGNSFLMHYLNNFQYKEYVGGSTRLKLTQTSLKTFPFPLPSLPEQKRIVTKLSSMFEKLKQAKELIQEARETFETRRAAILHKAFAGELTKEWRENNPENSLLSIRNDTKALCKTPSCWKWIKGEKLFIEKPRNGFSPKASANPTPVKTLKLGATTKGYFNNTEFKYIDKKVPRDSRLWLKNGDLLIQRANSIDYVGITAIYNGEDYGFIYPDLMMKTQVNKKYYIPALFVYWANSTLGRSYFKRNATGTAGNMPKINQSTVLNFPVPLIPMNEQKEIVRILDKILNKETESSHLIELENEIDLLEKSILSKAFRGELDTNNPDDEPAKDLLKRILQEKKEPPKKKVQLKVSKPKGVTISVKPAPLKISSSRVVITTSKEAQYLRASCR